MDRVILHSDINCFYASIEHLFRPEMNGKPLAVGGNEEARHGIILTADYLSRQYGVRTGMTLWQARKLCPELTIVSPRMDLYRQYSARAHEIYADYTDLIEPYGIDESWLDVSGSCSVKGDGESIAREINSRMKKELGITNSVGVSWNKVFAKLGSDYKKPDGITVFMREQLELIRSLPAKDLLYVGKKTAQKLETLGIRTIGHIADTPDSILQAHLGKMGLTFKQYALGLDDSPVRPDNQETELKSIGNSTTTPRDIVNNEEAKIVIYSLADEVAARMRKNNVKGKVVEVWVRNNRLNSFVRQSHLERYTNISDDIAGMAYRLFVENYKWTYPVRSLGVRVNELSTADEPEQMSFFDDPAKRIKKQNMENALDDIRRRFGNDSINRGVMYTDEQLSGISRKNKS